MKHRALHLHMRQAMIARTPPAPAKTAHSHTSPGWLGHGRRKINLAAALLALLTSSANCAESLPADSVDAALNLSLEELMQVVVTSVSRKAQTLAQTAAAAYVIQADDIRRSGASNIPEALRLAPGVQVSAIGANKWAVSIRGQADRFSNKLLVLVDGRSVYTPLFSGVFWEALDVPLENINRIEVIRGPGASIWGANAVNGVINIITHNAFDTLGGQVAVAAGSELRGKAFIRHGWNPHPDTAVQVHAKAENHDASRLISGSAGADEWRNQSAGFKLEHLLQRGTLRLQGGVTRSRAGDELTLITAPPALTPTRATQEIIGSHVMAVWDRQDETGNQESLQVYLQHDDYDHVVLNEQRYTLDLEYRKSGIYGEQHDLIWGVGYRRSGDQIENSAMFSVSESKRNTDLFSAYLQDEITLAPERWRLSLGARLEHNDYTGFELQPNARLLWTPNSRNSAWLSLAQAVRMPSRIERGGAAYVQADPVGALPALPPSLVQLVSNTLGEERLRGVDLGWRHQFSPAASLDLSAFHYRFDGLRGAAATPPALLPPGYLLIQTLENNANSAQTHGIEIALDWRPTPDWRLQANYSWLDMDIHTAGLPGQIASDYAGTSPSHQISLRSSLDLANNVTWDAWLRHVSRIDKYAIPAYTSLDMRLAWQAAKNLEISLVGQNLLDSAHPEYVSQFIFSAPSEIQRGVYANLDWKF